MAAMAAAFEEDGQKIKSPCLKLGAISTTPHEANSNGTSPSEPCNTLLINNNIGESLVKESPSNNICAGTSEKYCNLNFGQDNLLSKVGMSPETRRLIANASSEFLGTALLVFFGCMGTIAGFDKDHPPGSLQIGLAFGLTVASVITVFGHISGAHINPAVTLLSVVMRLTCIKTGAIFLIVQCLGAIIGFGLLRVVTPCTFLTCNDHNDHTCSTMPPDNVGALQALATELVATSMLLMICCSVWDPRNSNNTDCTPLKFGFFVTTMALVAGPLTGASMNPARTLGPAVWNADWRAHWVYWVGPLAAAIIVGHVWPVLFSPILEDDMNDNADIPLTSVSTDGKRRSKSNSTEDVAETKGRN